MIYNPGTIYYTKSYGWWVYIIESQYEHNLLVYLDDAGPIENQSVNSKHLNYFKYQPVTDIFQGVHEL